MKAEIKGNQLIITIDIDKNPKPSQSGKTLLLASTGGFQSNVTEFNGKPVAINVTATVKPD